MAVERDVLRRDDDVVETLPRGIGARLSFHGNVDMQRRSVAGRCDGSRRTIETFLRHTVIILDLQAVSLPSFVGQYVPTAFSLVLERKRLGENASKSLVASRSLLRDEELVPLCPCFVSLSPGEF